LNSINTAYLGPNPATTDGSGGVKRDKIEDGRNPMTITGATPILAYLQQTPTTAESLLSQPTSIDRIMGGG